MSERDSAQPYDEGAPVRAGGLLGIVLACDLKWEGWTVLVEWPDGSVSREHADSLTSVVAW